MITRHALLTIACTALVVGSTAMGAPDPTPSARAARFYAQGMERPLNELQRGTLLLKRCAKRMWEACSREQRKLARRNRTLALLDELTLFHLDAAPADDVTRFGDLRERIVVANAALTRAADVYDQLLIARYGAVLRACPPDDVEAHAQALEALTAVALRDFRGLSDSESAAARLEIQAAETQAAADLRDLPPDVCAAALDLGHLFMEMMSAKLRPWTREYRRVANADPRIEFSAAAGQTRDDMPSRDVAATVEGSFLAMVATELQLTVFPETAARIKAIAETEDTLRTETPR